MAQATGHRRASANSTRRRGNHASSQDGALASPFLANVVEPVRDQLGAAVDLETFLDGAETLTLDERKLLVEQALVLLDQNYVHLPFKVAMHAVNPCSACVCCRCI